MSNQHINSNGFNFSKTKIEVCNEYKKVSHDKCNCKKCVKVSKKNVCVMHLAKNDFLSSTLSVSTSANDAWEQFKYYIPNYIYGNFIISLTRKHVLRSMFAQLIKIKISPCTQIVSLYFKYNFIPNSACTGTSNFLVYGDIPNVSSVSNNTNDALNPYINPSIDNNNYAKLCNTTYYNVKFYCDSNYVFTPNFSNLPIYSCYTKC